MALHFYLSNFFDIPRLIFSTVLNETESNVVCVLSMRFGGWTLVWAPPAHFQWPQCEIRQRQKRFHLDDVMLSVKYGWASVSDPGKQHISWKEGAATGNWSRNLEIRYKPVASMLHNMNINAESVFISKILISWGVRSWQWKVQTPTRTDGPLFHTLSTV